jgi:hypothetical protein
MHDPELHVQPQAERHALSTRKEYRDALARLIGLAQRELRIFDPDFSDLEINSPQTYELLRSFMLRARSNQLYLVAHDTGYIRSYCPRLLNLLRQFSERMFIHQTQGEAASAQDSFVLADTLHLVRRPVQAQARASLRLYDEHEGQAMHLRFWKSGTTFPRLPRPPAVFNTAAKAGIIFLNGSREPRQSPFNLSMREPNMKRSVLIAALAALMLAGCGQKPPPPPPPPVKH